MAERITRAHLQARLDALNWRMEKRNSKWRYEVHKSMQYTLVRCYTTGVQHNTVMGGTKNQIAQYIHGMCTALDDSKDKL